MDTSKLKQFTEEDFILPETPPFSWLIRKTKELPQTQDATSTAAEVVKNVTNLNSPDEKATTAASKLKATATTNNNNNNSSFKSYESGDSQSSQKNINSGTSPIRSLLVVMASEDLSKTVKKSKPPQDEHLLKELVNNIFRNIKFFIIFLI